MTYLYPGAFFIAPRYYVIADEKAEDQTSGWDRALHSLTLDGGGTLAAFTSLEKAQEFIEAYYAEELQGLLIPLEVNAFELANAIAELEREGLRTLVFDPVATSAGRWADPRETMTSSYYLSFAGLMYESLGRLFENAAAKAGDWRNNRQDLQEVIDSCAPHVDEVIADSHALVQEWEAKCA